MTGSLVLVVGLLLAVLGLVGLVRGRVARLGMRNRAVAAVVAAAGMALALGAGGKASGAPDTLAAPPVRQGPVAANGAVRPAESSASTSPSGPASTSPSGPASSTPPAPVLVPRPSATPGPGTTADTDRGSPCAAADRAGPPRRPARQGPRAEDRLRPGPVRPGVEGRRPQRLRHPQRHPAPGPHGPGAQGRHERLRGGVGHAARPVPGQDRSRSCAGRTRRRPCRSTTSSRCRTRGRRAPSSGTTAKREAFAQRPAEPARRRRAANQQKGDGDTATWLPPNKAFRCAYVARQVA